MNHFVPDFDTDNDYIFPVSSSSPSLNLPRKSTMNEEDVMELIWHNDRVVIQSQAPQRPSVRKSSSPPNTGGVSGSGGGIVPPLPQSLHQQTPDQNMFIQEDEMASWLLYPSTNDDFCSDLLYSEIASSSASRPQSISRASSSILHAPPPEKSMNQTYASKPPVAAERRTENEPRAVRNFANFANFSRLRVNNTAGGCVESGSPSSSSAKAVVRESTLVGSCPTPSVARSDVTRRTDSTDIRQTVNDSSSSAASGGGASTSAAIGVRRNDTAVVSAAYDISGTSSPKISKGKEEVVHLPREKETAVPEDRKRKGREALDERDCASEEAKETRGSTSVKRSRAAEVHNLSERKRRDRINEKMKILQELIPRCNKSDKASMLDEAIEYMKALQLQVQMMSMGYGMMMPMVHPGLPQQQQYMAPPHMAMAMGMGMGMNHHPFTPFPNMIATPTMGGHMSGRAFQAPPPFPAPDVSDPSRVHVQSQHAEPPTHNEARGKRSSSKEAEDEGTREASY